MKYIIDGDDGTTYFGPYFEYLESVRSFFPESLRRFACDRDRYALSSRSSLHDSWLRKFSVVVGPRNDSESTTTDVRVQLLGPYHDRIHHLRYIDVGNISLTGVNGSSLGETDLLVHEFRYEDGQFVHELQFDKGGLLLLDFTQFEHSENLIGSANDVFTERPQ